MRYILWSGGWDSTYLLCKRARESDEEIQPICMAPNGYARVDKERAARWNIFSLLQGKKDIKAKIRVPIEIPEDGLPPWEEYDAAYKRTYAKHPEELEGMFGCLGRITKFFPQPEIGIEAPAPDSRTNNIGKMEALMLGSGLKLDAEGKVTPGVGDADILMILGCYQWPILHINEAQMLEDVKAWGYFDDIFQHTRSCYTNEDRCCGVCRACDIKLMYGDAFKFQFDEKALKDHAIKAWLENKGGKYADYFKTYAMNGNWVTLDDDTEKTKELITYFNDLEANWPKVDDINAPAL